MTFLHSLTQHLPGALLRSVDFQKTSRDREAPDWYTAGLTEASDLRTTLQLRDYQAGVRTGAPAHDDTPLSEAFSCRETAPGHLLGRRPDDLPQAMLALARVLANHQVGLVIDVEEDAAVAGSATLQHRQGHTRVDDARHQPLATLALAVRTPATRLPDLPGGSISDIRILTSPSDLEDVNIRPKHHDFQHLVLGGLFKGALSPEATMRAVERIEQARRMQPGQSVMTLCPSGSDAGAQLAVARHLYALHRQGQLSPHNLSTHIRQHIEQLTPLGAASVATRVSSLASLLDYGRRLLNSSSASLVPAARQAPPSPTTVRNAWVHR